MDTPNHQNPFSSSSSFSDCGPILPSTSMTSPPPSPPNAAPKNPWIRNSATVAAALSDASATTLAAEWPPLKASQIPAAESRAQAELQAEAEVFQPPDSFAVDPVAAPSPAPDSSSAPPPPPPVSTNHNRNHNPNHSNHRRGGRNQWRNHHPQGNRYPPWNPNPNVGFNRFMPPPVLSPPPQLYQWASFPEPPVLFYQNGYTDGYPHQFVYNAILPTVHPYNPVAPPIPFPPGQATAQLMIDIRKQIDYYFSEENLIKDGFLKRQMDKEFGWVDLKLIAGFRKVAALTDDLEIIKGSLASSDVVQLQGDKVRRKNDWQRWII